MDELRSFLSEIDFLSSVEELWGVTSDTSFSLELSCSFSEISFFSVEFSIGLFVDCHPVIEFHLQDKLWL